MDLVGSFVCLPMCPVQQELHRFRNLDLSLSLFGGLFGGLFQGGLLEVCL